MEKQKITKHKKFLRFLMLYLKKVQQLPNAVLLFTGIKIIIKGKIGVAGNSKKRLFRIRHGVCSFSKKSQRINYSHNIVRTHTGVLGIKCFIFY
jgi:ribosomal protein S3